MKKFLLFIFLLIAIARSDDVLLKDGRVWRNVNVLEKEETFNTITIFTSKGKRILINKRDVVGIKWQKFDPRRKSLLVRQDKEQSEDAQAFTPLAEGAAKNVPPPVAVFSQDTILQTFPQKRVNVETGYSYRTVAIPSGAPEKLRSYLNGLKNGFNFSAALQYFYSPEYGLGVRVAYFNASNYMDGIYYNNPETGESGVGFIEDKISLMYLGTGFSKRILLNSPNVLMVGSLTLGPLIYSDAARVADMALKVSGMTMALHGSLGVEYVLKMGIGIGGAVSYFIGYMEQVKVNNETVHLEEKENLNRIDVNFGLRYYF